VWTGSLFTTIIYSLRSP